MFTPLGWPERAFLAVVSLAAISPYPWVSVGTSLLLLGFGAWNWHRERLHPVTPRVPVVVTGRPTLAETRAVTPPTVMD
jgi:hypothetical protein